MKQFGGKLILQGENQDGNDGVPGAPKCECYSSPPPAPIPLSLNTRLGGVQAKGLPAQFVFLVVILPYLLNKYSGIAISLILAWVLVPLRWMVGLLAWNTLYGSYQMFYTLRKCLDVLETHVGGVCMFCMGISTGIPIEPLTLRIWDAHIRIQGP